MIPDAHRHLPQRPRGELGDLLGQQLARPSRQHLRVDVGHHRRHHGYLRIGHLPGGIRRRQLRHLPHPDRAPNRSPGCVAPPSGTPTDAPPATAPAAAHPTTRPDRRWTAWPRPPVAAAPPPPHRPSNSCAKPTNRVRHFPAAAPPSTIDSAVATHVARLSAYDRALIRRPWPAMEGLMRKPLSIAVAQPLCVPYDVAVNAVTHAATI